MWERERERERERKVKKSLLACMQRYCLKGTFRIFFLFLMTPIACDRPTDKKIANLRELEEKEEKNWNWKAIVSRFIKRKKMEICFFLNFEKNKFVS
jgi:hypothetical protein